MDTWVWIVIAVVVLGTIGIVAWMAWTKRRTASLKEGFGPEYERTVRMSDSRREAENELSARRDRRASLDIKPLSPSSRDRYADAWRDVQAGFVDEPAASLVEANRLVLIVMRERGYPMDDFEQRVADISVDHPDVVENYRSAHSIAVKERDGDADTESLRKAMTYYRSLFDELLVVDDGEDRRN
jgi:hypothetical protein